MLSSVEKDASNSRMASLGYLIASYQFIFPNKGYQPAKIANWIQDLSAESDLELTDVTDQEVNYILRLFSVGGLWSRDLQKCTRSTKTEDLNSKKGGFLLRGFKYVFDMAT